VQYLLTPATARLGRQLEDGAVIVGAATAGGAVEIAGGIGNQAGIGIGTVRVVEATQDF